MPRLHAMIDNQLSRIVLSLSCHPIGQLSLGGPVKSSRTVVIRTVGEGGGHKEVSVISGLNLEKMLAFFFFPETKQTFHNNDVSMLSGCL